MTSLVQIPDGLMRRIEDAADRAATPHTIWIQQVLREAVEQSERAKWASPADWSEDDDARQTQTEDR